MEGEVGSRTPSAKNIPYIFRAATKVIVIWTGSCGSVGWNEHERGEVKQRGARRGEMKEEREEVRSDTCVAERVKLVRIANQEVHTHLQNIHYHIICKAWRKKKKREGGRKEGKEGEREGDRQTKDIEK